MQEIIDHLTIIGFGHIGSSIGRAAKATNAVCSVSVCDNKKEHIKQAKKLKLADHYFDNPADSVKDADLVIIASHLGSYSEIAAEIAPHLKKGSIVSDVGSCKLGIYDLLKEKLPDHCHIIPAHPVAGTEKSGPKAGLSNMFSERHTILCPEEDCDPTALEKLKQFWHQLGAKIDIMDAVSHDNLLALTSHLPHLIAYALVGSAAGTPLSGNLSSRSFSLTELAKFSAGGFRDMTRIADSNPDMWCDVILHNRDALLEELSRFSEDLHILKKALRLRDRPFLRKWFSNTRNIRRHVVKLHQAGQYLPTETKSK